MTELLNIRGVLLTGGDRTVGCQWCINDREMTELLDVSDVLMTGDDRTVGCQ